MGIIKDYELYARSNYGISSTKLDSYTKHNNGVIEPYILEEREMNMTQMSVFSRLFKDRILFLGTDVNPDTANILTSQLMYLDSISENGGEDIKLYINSPGGSVTDGLAIYDVMQYITSDVQTYCMGMCASMGAVLLSSGEKGKRYSLPHGNIMIHQPLGGAHGQASDILIEAEEIKKCKTTLYEILSENTGKSIEEITRDADRNYWLTAQEAVNYGLIDSVIKKQ